MIRTFFSGPPARRAAALLLPAILLAGCQPPPRIDTLPEQLSQATGSGQAIVYHTQGEPIDANAPVPTVLTLPEAVRQALEHDPVLQGALARVRVALAEAKQNRLLPNPVLRVAFRFPEGGGTPVVEAGLAADLLGLLQKPRQIGAADHRLRAACAEAIKTALDGVAEVQERYATVQALDANLAVLEERRRIVQRLLGIAKARLQAGESSRLDVLTLDAQRADLDTERLEILSERTDQRLALARLLGLPNAEATWSLAEWSPLSPPAGKEPAWIAAALLHRPEIQAQRWELAALGDEEALAHLSFLEGGGVGVSAERDGTWTVGPALDTPLPIFDWGQARREKTAAQVTEARHHLTDLQRKAVEEVRRAWAAVMAANGAVAHVQSDLLPLQEQRRAQAEAQYKNGLADVTAVLLAEQDAQAGRAKLIAFQKDHTLALARLFRAVGGAGAADVAQQPPTTAPSATLPSTQPATSNGEASR